MIKTAMKTSKNKLLQYLADAGRFNWDIPSISELSRLLGMSTASVREQLEVARSLGIVEVKPRLGIQKLPYSLNSVLTLSLRYGVQMEPGLSDEVAELRKHLEQAYWYEAVAQLKAEDLQYLNAIVDEAMRKVHNTPVLLPRQEHREFHLGIYRPLGNGLLYSLLESFWDLFTESEISIYADQTFLENTWVWHRKMLVAIEKHEYEQGYEALCIHFDAVKIEKKAVLLQRFE